MSAPTYAAMKVPHTPRNVVLVEDAIECLALALDELRDLRGAPSARPDARLIERIERVLGEVVEAAKP